MSADLVNNIATFVGVFVAVIGAFLFAFWAAMGIWTFNDIRSRSRDWLAILLACIMVLIFPIVGLILYTMIRPKATLAEVYDRALEEEALLRELEEAQSCYTCGVPVKDNWVYCPNCHSQLQHPCPSCHNLARNEWGICVYCGTQQRQVTGQSAGQPKGQLGGQTVGQIASQANQTPEQFFNQFAGQPNGQISEQVVRQGNGQENGQNSGYTAEAPLGLQPNPENGQQFDMQPNGQPSIQQAQTPPLQPSFSSRFNRGTRQPANQTVGQPVAQPSNPVGDKTTTQQTDDYQYRPSTEP